MHTRNMGIIENDNLHLNFLFVTVLSSCIKLDLFETIAKPYAKCFNRLVITTTKKEIDELQNTKLRSRLRIR